MKEFFQRNWKKILIVLLVVFCLILAKATFKRSIIIGQPDNIILITPEESQDVIIIGDPDKVKVKPNNKK